MFNKVLSLSLSLFLLAGHAYPGIGVSAPSSTSSSTSSAVLYADVTQQAGSVTDASFDHPFPNSHGSYTMTGGTLSEDGTGIHIFGVVRSTGSNNIFRLMFGATELAKNTPAANTVPIFFDCYVFRRSSTTQIAWCSSHFYTGDYPYASVSGAGAKMTTPAETLSGDVTVQFQYGDASAGSECIFEMMIVTKVDAVS